MEKSYVVLMKSILEVRLSHKRANDIDVSPDLYQIAFTDVADSYGKVETRVALRNTKLNDFEVNVRQLAALRIADPSIPVTATWVDEFEANPGTSVLQTKCMELQTAGTDLSSIKLRCVKRLRIRNKFSAQPDAPVYKDACYAGHIEFSKDSATLRTGKDAEFFKSVEFGMQYKALKDKLQGTTLLPGKNTDENLVYIPVFEVV